MMRVKLEFWSNSRIWLNYSLLKTTLRSLRQWWNFQAWPKSLNWIFLQILFLKFKSTEKQSLKSTQTLYIGLQWFKSLIKLTKKETKLQIKKRNLKGTKMMMMMKINMKRKKKKIMMMKISMRNRNQNHQKKKESENETDSHWFHYLNG